MTLLCVVVVVVDLYFTPSSLLSFHFLTMNDLCDSSGLFQDFCHFNPIILSAYSFSYCSFLPDTFLCMCSVINILVLIID